MTHRFAAVAALAALCAPLELPAAAQEASPAELWRPAANPLAPAALDAVAADPTVTRWRPIALNDPEALATAPAGRATLELFDGRRVTVDLERRATPRPGSAGLYGAIAGGAPDDHLTLALVDGAVAATIWVDGQLYGLQHAPSGELLLVERTDEAPGTCATGHGHRVGGERSTGGPPGDGGGGSQGGAGAAVAASELVDVVTAYTPEARQGAGGTSKILALIDLAVLETNLSYDNCEAGIELRLVHADEVDYTESGSMSTDLSRLRAKTDGHMDEVHAWRDAYGGDAVSLIVNGGGYCGIAYLMTNVSQGFQSSAFSVTARGCATGYYTYGHELGHNFGCAHDKANAGGASKNYAYGYRTPNNLYRTVMAYSPGSRKPIFSSPDHLWNGYVMGVANSEDNSRALTLNAPTIASWRDTVVEAPDCDGDGVPDSIEIADGTAVDVDGNGLPDDCQTLTGDVASVSLVFGGAQSLALDAGPAYAGRLYVMLGSLAGTDVGTPLGAVTVPLNQDAYYDLTVAQPATGLMLGAFGFLDAQGRGSAQFVMPAGVSQFDLVTTPANHAFVTLDAALVPDFASNPVPVAFTVL